MLRVQSLGDVKYAGVLQCGECNEAKFSFIGKKTTILIASQVHNNVVTMDKEKQITSLHQRIYLCFSIFYSLQAKHRFYFTRF